jgi:hypothetical protein
MGAEYCGTCHSIEQGFQIVEGDGGEEIEVCKICGEQDCRYGVPDDGED